MPALRYEACIFLKIEKLHAYTVVFRQSVFVLCCFANLYVTGIISLQPRFI